MKQKGYYINVEGFPEWKKKRVQDAFFKLGLKWVNNGYKYLDKGVYTNIEKFNNDSITSYKDYLMQGSIYDPSDSQKAHEIYYEELLKEVGMEYIVDLNEEIDVKLTWRQIAKCYAVLGNTNGYSNPWPVFKKLLNAIDVEDGQHRYEEFFWGGDVSEDDHYVNYEDKWVDFLFKLPEEKETEKETEKDRKIRELKEQVEALSEQIQELEDN